jgi:hypothetical protein
VSGYAQRRMPWLRPLTSEQAAELERRLREQRRLRTLERQSRPAR